MEKRNTIFCDIDGTLFKYRKFETYETSDPELLDGVKDKLDQWCNDGHMIILTTARPEYLRVRTVWELALHDLPYQRLIMEIERGPRFLINDMDPKKPGERAIGIDLIRNTGLGSTNWDEYRDM
tara:strand:+ start:2544 stop:2915 length:372 start_codon:yes stop_codon:yes gene_type:complete